MNPLTLVFAGGAAGKLVCGFLGARIGMLATVIATEGLTALGIAMSLLLPLAQLYQLAVHKADFRGVRDQKSESDQ